MNRPVVISLALATIVGLAACGGDSDTASDSSSASGGSSSEAAPSEGAGGELKSYQTAALPMSWGEYKARSAPTEKKPPAGSTAQYLKDGDAIGAEFISATILPTDAPFDATVTSMGWGESKKVNDHLVCTSSGATFCLAEMEGGVLMTNDANLINNPDTFATMTEGLYQSLP